MEKRNRKGEKPCERGEWKENRKNMKTNGHGTFHVPWLVLTLGWTPPCPLPVYFLLLSLSNIYIDILFCSRFRCRFWFESHTTPPVPSSNSLKTLGRWVNGHINIGMFKILKLKIMYWIYLILVAFCSLTLGKASWWALALYH